MGMRTTAGLNSGDLCWIAKITDIKNSNATNPVITDRFRNAL